jgi:hypothetical protein
MGDLNVTNNTNKGSFKAKEELWKLKYLTMQKYNLPKML